MRALNEFRKTIKNQRFKAVLLLLVAYLYWTGYSLIYPFIGRWSIDYTKALLTLPGTSHDFVLGLLLWTISHRTLYILMDALYRLGFTGVMFGATIYLLFADPRDAERITRNYFLAFLILSVIFSMAHVYPPHLVYPDLPRKYSPPGWQARPQFVLPSPHCTVDTVTFLVLFRRRDPLSRLLALLTALIPVSTVLLAEHWIWDALTGIALGYLTNRFSENVFNAPKKILFG